MPRKTAEPKPDPVETITDRVLGLSKGIHDAEHEIEELETFLYGHEGPPRDVTGIVHEIADVTRRIETQERIAREAQAVADSSRKTLAELTARKESAEAKGAELIAQIEKDKAAVKSIVHELHTKGAV